MSYRARTIACLLMLLVVSGCKKESMSPGVSIDSLSKFWDGQPDIKQRFQLRMALAKTVSAAFASREFTKWFMEQGFVARDNHFDELVLALYKDVPMGNSGKTLIEFLEGYMDKEVSALFGAHLFDLILQYDPCVVIKMPDIFREVDWDPNRIRPVVIPQLPYTNYMETIFGSDRWFPVYYMGQALQPVWDPKTYFYVTIKYSEDYFLLDPGTMENERGISFYEILPQAKQCNNGMTNDLVELGEPHPIHPHLILVPRLKAFFRWQELCGYQDKYWSRDNDCPDQDCIRTCIPEWESVYVIDSFKMNGYVIFQLLNNNIHLEDSYTYSCSFWSVFPKDGHSFRFTVPALPHEWFESRLITIKILTSSFLAPPRINYSAIDRSSNKFFPVKAKVKSFVLPEDVTSYSFDYIVYAERTDLFAIYHPIESKHFELTASQLFGDHLANIFGCDPEQNLKYYSAYTELLFTY